MPQSGDSWLAATGEQSLDGSYWFLRLFGVAIIAHLAGNPSQSLDVPGLTSLLLGLVAAVLIARPTWQLATLSAGLVLATVWFEAPILGNHWLVVGLLAMLMIAAFLRTFRYSGDPATTWWQTVAPSGRLLMLIFYSFSAFAKLNSGFFHPEVSCGRFYANQWLGSWRLPTFGPGNGSVFVAIAVVLIELAVPLLLLRPATRRWGVLLATGFHAVIAFDLDQHFYDFTSVVLLLVALFWSEADLARAEGLVRRWPIAPWATAAVGAALVVASVTSGRPGIRSAMETGAFIWFAPIALLLFGLALQPRDRTPFISRMRPVGVGATLVLALTILNGLSPYLEIKTASGFNMYSNLRTVDGESNHFVVPRTLRLSDEQADTVLIVASDDPGLAQYVDSGYALTMARLADYLSYSSPEATVTVQDANTGAIESLTAGAVADRLPLFQDKLVFFRSHQVDEPVTCQPRWLPAS